MVRYGQFGGSATDIARNLIQQPGLFADALRRPAVARYFRDLWFSSGGLAILYPLALLMALPSLAINSFSSYDWMHSGGGHYSATIVPFLVIAAIYGVEWVARKAGNWPIGKLTANTRVFLTSLLLIGLGLMVAFAHHYRTGIAPSSRRFVLEPVSDHARRAESFLEQINNLPDNDQLCREAVWFSQKMLLGSKKDMNDIADSIVKIYENRDGLLKKI